MHRRRFLAVGGAALLWSKIGWAYTDQTADLNLDIRVVREALKLHPGLYRYNGNQQIEDMLLRFEQHYRTANDLQGRFLSLQNFLAGIRCGHTQCNFYNQSNAVIDALFERKTRLPFSFTWIDYRMIVLSDFSGSAKLPRGSEIIRVNDVKVSTMLERLLPYTRADGANADKRLAQLEMRNIDRFEYFDIYHGLLFPPSGQVHRLNLRLPDGRQIDLEMPALTMAERQKHRRTGETNGTDQPFWDWTVDNEIAVLTMPSWAMYNSKWNWQSWLNDRLDSLSGLKGMIIDLRDNEGGNDCGNIILSRLADRDMKFTGYQRRVRYRTTSSALDPYLDTWDDSFRTIGADASDIGDGFFLLPGRDEENDFIAATKPKITVPVAALVGPACSSATFSFARRAQQSGLIKLFGEPTGGNLRGINGGAFFFVKLPGSGIEFDLPLIGYYPPSPQPDRGVIPDIVARRTVADVISGNDSVMAKAKKWIGKQ